MNSYLACVQAREALQIIDYSYHIRGSVNCINCVNGTPTLNATEGDLFAMKLDHEEDGRFYNGLISKQSWLTATPPLGAGGLGLRSYLYDYDNVNRFKSAAYTGVGAENYSLNNVSYDQNGNIQSLQRYGSTGTGTWGTIDNLSYNYGANHNQLQQVNDAVSGNPDVGDFRASNTNYEYWIDGALKKDPNRNITNISYNYLGLPEEITLTNNRWIRYYYDGLGGKYKKIIHQDGIPDLEVHYQGDLIYHKKGNLPLGLYSLANDEGGVISKQ